MLVPTKIVTEPADVLVKIFPVISTFRRVIVPVETNVPLMFVLAVVDPSTAELDTKLRLFADAPFTNTNVTALEIVKLVDA